MIRRYVENKINKKFIFLLIIGCAFNVQILKAQSTQTFSYTTPTVTSDDTGGFVDALTIDVPTSAFPADYVTTDVNLVINYDKTDGSCASPGTDNSYHDEHGFQLQSPIATQVTVFDPGQFSGATSTTPGVTQTFDDASVTAIPGGIPATGTYMPNNSFTSFNGQNPEGTWTLRASETAGGDPLCIIGVDIVITAEELSAPGNVTSNIALWLKADAGVTGTTEVSVWADQSGNANNAAQSTTSRRPSLQTDAFNFNPALTFDGTDDFLDVPYNALLNDDNMTVFSVHRVEQDDNSWRSPFTSRDDFPQRGYIVYVRSDNDQYDLWTGSDSGWDSFQQGLTPGADLQILGVDFTASTGGNGDKNFYLDGNLQGSTTSTENYVANTAQPYRVGAGSSETVAGQYFWYGDIAEQIVYNRLLATEERLKVSSYLAIKYGITLTHDYYSTAYDGTNALTETIYDVDNGYGNDVAGIGKDDNEALNQVSSKSENNSSVLTVTSPTSLDDGDYLIWGNNALSGTNTSDFPSGFDERLSKIWFFDETGETGLVTIKFDLSQLGNRSDNPDDYALLISNSAVFSSASTHTNGAQITDNVLSFTNVDISDGDYISLAVSPIGSPGNVRTGMDLWLVGDFVTTEIDGTLDSWSDQSGQQNHGTPITLNRPVLETVDKLNSNSYVNFTNDEAGQVSLSSNTNESSFFAVLKSSTNGSDIFEIDDNTNPMLEVENGIYRLDANTSIVSSTAVGNWNIVEMIHGDTPTKQLFVDGSLEDSDATALTIAASANYNLFSNFTGEVAEAIHYDNALANTERRQVESYLAVKYGITLDISTQDYLNGSGTTILNRTNFASYSNNIAGIGKANADSGNDSQGLNQTQSQSINSTGIVSVSAASNMEDGEYLLWGSNNETALASLSESAPSPAITNVSMVLDRKWKVTETGDLGTVSISFDLSSVSSVSGRELAQFTLIIDDTENISSPVSSLKPTSFASGVLTFENVDFAEGQYFVLGTDGNSSPGNISSNLSLWFKAGSGIITSGSDVTNWVDQSSAGLDLNTPRGNPTLSSNAINSNNSVTFDGDDNIYNSGTYNTEDLLSGGALTGDYTFYIVAKHNASNPAEREIFFSNGSNQFRYGLHSNPRVHLRENNTASTNVTPSSLVANQPNIYTIKRTANNSGAGGTLYINGANDNTYSTSDGVRDGTKIVIGGESSGDANNSWEGDIAEVIAFATSEDDTDRQKIETYLAIKYGITLSNDYYRTAYDGTNAGSTTIYDVSNGYANDIAGIGREDNELLAQVESKSENTDAILTIGSPSSLDDVEYLVWGNDNGTLTETTSGVPSGVNDMLTRKWSVTETGDVGTVNVAFDVTGIAGIGTESADFALIIDNDADFSSGTTLLTADDFSSNIVTFSGIDFSNGTVFGLATGISSNLTEISSSVGDYEVTTGCPVFSGNGFIEVRDASNRLAFSINPNGNNLGATCWGVRIRTSGDDDVLINDEDYYLDRNYYITPTTQPSTDVTVKFYFLDTEVDDIRTKLIADGKQAGSSVSEYFQDYFGITKKDGADLNPETGSQGARVTSTISAFGTEWASEVNVSSFSEFAMGTDSGDPSSSLPVELIYFEGSANNDTQVILGWATASELNNDYFEIQKSMDGVNFSTIGKENGHGTVDEEMRYSFVDRSSNMGQSYYRLKQVDFDGAFEYSEIIRIDMLINHVDWVTYPNPTNGPVTFSTNQEIDVNNTIITIIDLAGKMVNLPTKINYSSIELDMYNLQPGVYVVVVQNNQSKSTHRVIRK